MNGLGCGTGINGDEKSGGRDRLKGTGPSKRNKHTSKRKFFYKNILFTRYEAFSRADSTGLIMLMINGYETKCNEY